MHPFHACESSSFYVHEATWVIASNLECGIPEALGRLKIRADATCVTVDELAIDVLEGREHFDL